VSAGAIAVACGTALRALLLKHQCMGLKDRHISMWMAPCMLVKQHRLCWYVLVFMKHSINLA
jgi:hypothetical protein